MLLSHNMKILSISNFDQGTNSKDYEFLEIYEPPRGKTNVVVSDQVRYKSTCTATEAG